MPKVLVIAYSYTGTSRRVAALLAAHFDWPLGEVLETRPRAGATGMVRCVLDSLLRRRPATTYRGPAPEDFDAVIVVAPVWVKRLAAPMRSFLAERAASLPASLAMVTVMAARGGENAVAEAATLLGRTPRLWTAVTQREAEDGSAHARIEAFGAAVCALGAPAEPLRPAELSPKAA